MPKNKMKTRATSIRKSVAFLAVNRQRLATLLDGKNRLTVRCTKGIKNLLNYGNCHRHLQVYLPLRFSLVGAVCGREAVLERKLVEGWTHYGGHDAHRPGPSAGGPNF